jgi:hypothetical protein
VLLVVFALLWLVMMSNDSPAPQSVNQVANALAKYGATVLLRGLYDII